MTQFWIVAVGLFLLVTLALAQLTQKKYREKSGEKNWKTQGSRTHYWELLTLCSLGITTALVFLLKWSGFVVV
jgi:CBS domain containing-hemolysin-like protein